MHVIIHCFFKKDVVTKYFYVLRALRAFYRMRTQKPTYSKN